LTFNFLEEFTKLHPSLAENSLYFPEYSGPLFKSPELGNYQIMVGFPGYKSGAEVPVGIDKLLKISKGTVGAYSPVQ
jgi:hypothetical protein